jgi:hypothetical protein
VRIIGCDLHARQQTLVLLDNTTGEVVKATLRHEGNVVREFYSNLPRPMRVRIEATGSMQWSVRRPLASWLGSACVLLRIFAFRFFKRFEVGFFMRSACHTRRS